jgi:hypothetical protein
MIDIDKLIKESNRIVKIIDRCNKNDSNGNALGIDLDDYIQKHHRYEEIGEIIKLSIRAEKKKEKQEIRSFITKNKKEILTIAGNECEVCEFNFKPVLIIHHKKPISEGGTNELNNLSVLCPTCHKLIHYLMRNDDFNDPLRIWAKSHLTENDYNKMIIISNNTPYRIEKGELKVDYTL